MVLGGAEAFVMVKALSVILTCSPGGGGETHWVALFLLICHFVAQRVATVA